MNKENITDKRRNFVKLSAFGGLLLSFMPSGLLFSKAKKVVTENKPLTIEPHPNAVKRNKKG
jgi:hypothetical protein